MINLEQLNIIKVAVYWIFVIAAIMFILAILKQIEYIPVVSDLLIGSLFIIAISSVLGFLALLFFTDRLKKY